MLGPMRITSFATPLLVAYMFTQSTGAGAAEDIGTVTQVYDGTLTSDIQVRTYRNIDQLFPVRVVKEGTKVLALLPASKQLTQLELSSGSNAYDLIDYLASN